MVFGDLGGIVVVSGVLYKLVEVRGVVMGVWGSGRSRCRKRYFVSELVEVTVGWRFGRNRGHKRFIRMFLGLIWC